jgi:hypothetical protein
VLQLQRLPVVHHLQRRALSRSELLELLELPVVKGHPAAESNFSCSDTATFGAHLVQVVDGCDSFSHGAPAGTAGIGDVTAFRGSLHCKVGATLVVDSGAGERLGQGGGAGTAWRGLSG